MCSPNDKHKAIWPRTKECCESGALCQTDSPNATPKPCAHKVYLTISYTTITQCTDNSETAHNTRVEHDVHAHVIKHSFRIMKPPQMNEVAQTSSHLCLLVKASERCCGSGSTSVGLANDCINISSSWKHC